MSEISTKREDVERLAHGSENYNGDWLVDHSIEIAATLRALLDERDAAVVRAERWDTEAAAARVIIPRLETERDAALAEVARLRDLLAEAVEEIEATITATYADTEKYPDQMRRRDRDMDIVRRIRAALAQEEVEE